MNIPKQWKTGLKIAALSCLILLVANPELRAFLLLIDYAGLDLILLLLAMQFGDMGRHAFYGAALPFYQFLCRFSVLPCWIPPWHYLRERPSLILHALPYDAAILFACMALLAFLLLTGAPLRFH